MSLDNGDDSLDLVTGLVGGLVADFFFRAKRQECCFRKDHS